MKILKKIITSVVLLFLCSGLSGQAIEAYFNTGNLSSISTEGTAAGVSTFTLDTLCETLRISVTDPIEAPLPGFNAYIFNGLDAEGNSIKDITGKVNVTMRVRSAEAINISVLFRSGGGTSEERSDRKDFDIPAGLTDWTEFTLTWEVSDLAGFITSDLKDMWFYVDRGEENFAGNELYIDHIVVGGLPDASQISPCNFGTDPSSFEEYFTRDSLTSINLTSSAGAVTTFSLDTLCGILELSVTDPNSAPLPAFNAYQVKALGPNGEEVKDISSNVSTSFRLRSLAEVTIDVLFRSGSGETTERSERKSFTVPAGLDIWSEFTLSWEGSELSGFDAMNLRDMWFYVDRGEENFAGNQLFIDHITIGIEADPEQNTSCDIVAVPQDWVEQFVDDGATPFTGSEVEKLNISIDETCEEVKIEVADPDGSPFQALRPLVLDPLDSEGMNFSLINENPVVNIRARSADDVQVSVLLRSRDGTSDFRTATKTKTIIGSLEEFSNLIFEFDAESIGGFDVEEFLDIWIYLDQDVDNFAGNEVYIDFVSLGSLVDQSEYSPCGLVDIIINTEDLQLGSLKVFPNPITDILNIEIPENNLGRLTYEVRNLLGQKVLSNSISGKTLKVNFSDLETGIYWLSFSSDGRLLETSKVVKAGK